MPAQDEILALMHQAYDAMWRGDAAWIEQRLSGESKMLVIGSDPSEWWEGPEQARRAWTTQLPELTGMRFGPTRLRAHVIGDMGWAADEPSFEMPDGSAGSIRLTVIFHRHDGRWQIVHSHASIGVPNRTAIGRDLPT